MASFDKICCGIDFSEPSRAAMTEAAQLARRHEGELTLVHVWEPPPAVGKDAVVSPPELFAQTRVEMERKLEGWRAEAERLAGLPVDAAVLAGNPAEELVRFARERFCDTIVMATHGRTGLRRLVLGSVAEKVVRTADCTVMVVRQPKVEED